ncbi:MAG: PQQ-like beta-propeller repeat protein [Anaerolineae bacterium]|nr:PQQ-like beta-propeller repeat protein [Anaerolineae bacterium]
MPSITVKAHALRDIRLDASDRERFGHMFFNDWQKDPEFSQGLISFVCMAYNPTDGLLYCGLTALDNDVLYTFDLDQKTFRSLGFPAVAERFDVKIHRSLEIDDDGMVYGATACLHGLDQQAEAQGGKLFRYDPRRGKYEMLGMPVPPNYVQTIALDKRRGILYGYTYPEPHAFRFDIDLGRTKDLGNVGRDTHSPILDDEGNLWGTWLQSWGLGLRVPPRSSLFRYNPDRDEMTWYKVGLPSLYPGDIAYVDSVVNGGDGYIYIGTTAGALLRLDPKAVEVSYLGRPLLSPRMPGLVVGHDGLLYGSGGDGYDTHLFACDRDTGRFTDLGQIYDPLRRTSCVTTHFLVEPRPGLFYVAETDNYDRSGYLWECQVKW